MSQAEIFTWLKNRLQMGEEKFWSPKEISSSLGINSRTANDKLGSLFRAGFIEIEQDGLWKRKYRLKRKYLK